MFPIANNITTRDPDVGLIFNELKASGWDIKSRPARALSDIVINCVAAGARAIEINTQQHFDTPDAMECAVNIVQHTTDLKICLSTNNVEAMEAGIHACNKTPIINFVSIDVDKLRDILPMAAVHNAEVIFLVSDTAAPADAREMLGKTAVLLGVAKNAGIPDSNILVDPGLIHVTSEIGQRHMVELIQYLRAIDTLGSSIRTACWLGNASAGAPLHVRKTIELTLLPMLAGMGLSAVFLNVLRTEYMRTLRLIRVFNNDLIYAQQEFE
jgi:cobalamin-dependent methionine synthase I